MLKGLDSFDDLVEGAIRLREAGSEVHACFVCTPRTYQRFGEVLASAVALGIRRVAFNLTPRRPAAGRSASGTCCPPSRRSREALAVGEWAAVRHGMEITDGHAHSPLRGRAVPLPRTFASHRVRRPATRPIR